MDEDEYWTIAGAGLGEYKEKGSKFLSYLHPFSQVTDLQDFLQKISKEHPKARHICYAYRVGIKGEITRSTDDGEPSGTAGKPILNVLLSQEVSDVFCGVVRYFGGTKLGTSGLIRAYKSAAEDAFLSIEKKIVTITSKLLISYRSEDMGLLYTTLKRHGCDDITQLWEQGPQLKAEVPKSKATYIRKSLIASSHGYEVSDITEDFVSDRIKIKITSD